MASGLRVLDLALLSNMYAQGLLDLQSDSVLSEDFSDSCSWDSDSRVMSISMHRSMFMICVRLSSITGFCSVGLSWMCESRHYWKQNVFDSIELLRRSRGISLGYLNAPSVLLVVEDI